VTRPINNSFVIRSLASRSIISQLETELQSGWKSALPERLEKK